MARPDLSTAHVLVVGDVMLDRYWFGEVSRISPEAPVPVVRITRSEERPGGAANVARNVSGDRRQGRPAGRDRDDEPGAALARLLEAEGVHAQLTRDATLNTTVKLRVIGRQQQLLRIDFENPPAPEALEAKRADFDARLSAAKVVIFSDYGKGGLAHVDRMIPQARSAGKIVLVDPKGDDFEKYRHATVLTPNLGEFRAVVGRWSSEAELADKAQQLRRALQLDALLVTRSEEGMTLFREGEVAARAGGGQGSLRRERGGGHRHRHARRHAGGRARARGRGALGEQGGRHRGRQARHRRGPSRRAFRLTSATGART